MSTSLLAASPGTTRQRSACRAAASAPSHLLLSGFPRAPVHSAASRRHARAPGQPGAAANRLYSHSYTLQASGAGGLASQPNPQQRHNKQVQAQAKKKRRWLSRYLTKHGKADTSQGQPTAPHSRTFTGTRGTSRRRRAAASKHASAPSSSRSLGRSSSRPAERRPAAVSSSTTDVHLYMDDSGADTGRWFDDYLWWEYWYENEHADQATHDEPEAAPPAKQGMFSWLFGGDKASHAHNSASNEPSRGLFSWWGAKASNSALHAEASHSDDHDKPPSESWHEESSVPTPGGGIHTEESHGTVEHSPHGHSSSSSHSSSDHSSGTGVDGESSSSHIETSESSHTETSESWSSSSSHEVSSSSSSGHSGHSSHGSSDSGGGDTSNSGGGRLL